MGQLGVPDFDHFRGIHIEQLREFVIEASQYTTSDLLFVEKPSSDDELSGFPLTCCLLFTESPALFFTKRGAGEQRSTEEARFSFCLEIDEKSILKPQIEWRRRSSARSDDEDALDAFSTDSQDVHQSGIQRRSGRLGFVFGTHRSSCTPMRREETLSD